MISKKIVFWVSFVISLIFAGFLFVNTGTDYCYSHSFCMEFRDFRNFIGMYLLIFPVIFFFSLITYKMRDEVSMAWLKFSAVYIPLFILIGIFLTNNSRGGGELISAGYFSALILFFLLVVYFITSFIIIIKKHNSLKKLNPQK